MKSTPGILEPVSCPISFVVVCIAFVYLFIFVCIAFKLTEHSKRCIPFFYHLISNYQYVHDHNSLQHKSLHYIKRTHPVNIKNFSLNFVLRYS